MLLLRTAVLVVALATMATAANAAKRVALVIGNAAYTHAVPLDNPINDAKEVAGALEKHGIKVLRGFDLDQAGMRTIIRNFSRALTQGSVGIFYYAGHGVQVSGKNYLVPTDAKLKDSLGIDFELIRLEQVHAMMEQSTKTNILFLDACRNNPLARNLARAMGTRFAAVGSGLAPMESGIGSLISFSTQPGNVALDGRGQRNSPYSASLAKHIATGSGDITEILIKVRRDVMSATSRKQVPWEHSALTRQFYFSSPDKPAERPATSASEGSKPSLTFRQQAELAFWNSVKTSNDPALLQSYLKQYPTGAFAPLAKVMIGQAKSEIQGRAPSNEPKTQVASAGAAQAATGEQSVTRDTAQPDAKAKTPAPTSYAGLQRQLRSLGCYKGALDGAWGRGSQAALGRAYGDRTPPSLSEMKSISPAKFKSVLDYLGSVNGKQCRPTIKAKAVPRVVPRKKSRRDPPVRRARTRSKPTPKLKPRPKRASPPRKVVKRRPAKKKNCRLVIGQVPSLEGPDIRRVCN